MLIIMEREKKNVYATSRRLEAVCSKIFRRTGRVSIRCRLFETEIKRTPSNLPNFGCAMRTFQLMNYEIDTKLFFFISTEIHSEISNKKTNLA